MRIKKICLMQVVCTTLEEESTTVLMQALIKYHVFMTSVYKVPNKYYS